MQRPIASATFGAWLLLAVTLPVSVWVLWESQRVIRSDWASAAARKQVSDWVAGQTSPASPAAWEDARRAIQASLEISPDDPDLQDRMGDLHTVAGQRDWADPALRRAHFTRAAESYQRAIDLRPSESETWAMLAASLQAMGEDRASVHAAWATARRLGPYEAHVQPVLMQVVLADWVGAGKDMQDWASALFDGSSAGRRADINAMAQRYGLKFSGDKPAATR